MKKGLIFLGVLYFLLSSNKSSAKTLTNTRATGKKFLAKFNVLRSFTTQFVERVKSDGFTSVDFYDAQRTYENEPLDKVTFYLTAEQLLKFDVLKSINEVEFISLLIIE
jgi:hypothetical protein